MLAWDSGGGVRNSWERGKEQVCSIALVISVNVSVEKNKRCETATRSMPRLWFVQNSIENQSQPVHFVQMWTAVGFRAFRHMPRDVYSYDSSWYKNIQRHAQTGTSLQP